MKTNLRFLMRFAVTAFCAMKFFPVADALAGEIKFEKVQLSDQFYSEGGTFGDYNGDGHGDVVVGPWIYLGPDFETASRFYAGDPVDPAGYSENFLMYSDDVNADGRLDILVLGFPGKESWWYENPGNITATRSLTASTAGESDGATLWKQHVMLSSVDNESPLIADIDRDGIKDLICCTGGRIVYASHAGSDPTQPWKVTPISTENGYQRFTHGLGIGDVNNDGHQDAIEKDGWWQNPGKTLADGETWDFHPVAFATAGAQMYAVDLDGDSRNEVLTSVHAHGFGMVYFKATDEQATQFEKIVVMGDSPENSPVGIAVSQMHGVDLADINRDGIQDIVSGKRWWAHKNKDDGNEMPATLFWLETQRQSGRVAFKPHVIDIGSGVGTQITAGDVNGDGLVDIVAGIKRGAYLFLQRPSDLDDGVSMVPGLSKLDRFGQNPALDSTVVNGRILPARDGKPLNFDFEAMALVDWEQRGPIAKKSWGENDGASQFGMRTIKTAADAPGAVGELISRPFVIPGDSWVFTVGGAADASTRVELVLESSGQPVVTWTGADGGADAKDYAFDVTAHRGQLARIRIVDHSDKGWIQVDNFYFK